MKRLVYIIVFALGLTACYDDKTRTIITTFVR